jgi:hypothetical protein
MTMRVMTKAEVSDWFAQFPGRTSEHVQFDSDGLFFTDPEANCIDLEYPPKLERLPFFARILSTIGYTQLDFRGALVWITGWGVWQDAEEGIGYRIVETMNRAAGQQIAFEQAQGHHFRADELTEAIGLLLQPMIFAWDAYYLPQWAYGTDEFFIHVSHDSFVSVPTRTKSFYERIFELLEKADLKPAPGHELQVKRFCRR